MTQPPHFDPQPDPAQQAPITANSANSSGGQGLDNGLDNGPAKTYPAKTLILACVGVLIVAGLVGYLLGHKGGESSGQTSGEKTGYAQGKTAGEAMFAQGTPGYQEIYKTGYDKGFAAGDKAGKKAGVRAGKKAGDKAGLAKGEKIGYEQGYQKGDQVGAGSANKTIAGGYTNWLVDQPYIIVTAATGEKTTPFAVSSRYQMQDKYYYYLCSAGSPKVCHVSSKSLTGK